MMELIFTFSASQSVRSFPLEQKQQLGSNFLCTFKTSLPNEDGWTRLHRSDDRLLSPFPRLGALVGLPAYSSSLCSVTLLHSRAGVASSLQGTRATWHRCSISLDFDLVWTRLTRHFFECRSYSRKKIINRDSINRLTEFQQIP